MLFSLYNENAADHDGKLAENWNEKAPGIMFLVRHASPFRRVLQCSPKYRQSGLTSATVGGFLSVLFYFLDKLSRRLDPLSQPPLQLQVS